MSWYIWIFIILLVLAGATEKKPRKRRRRSKSIVSRPKRKGISRSSLKRRSDEMILRSHLSDLTGGEFERLMALYFRDHGYTVEEVGRDGNDGGVDLVITNRRGERIAVQLKCYSEKKIKVNHVRELVGAKRNHGCVLAMLITTSDFTPQARKEAEERKIEIWHGQMVADKLRRWGKYHPR